MAKEKKTSAKAAQPKSAPKAAKPAAKPAAKKVAKAEPFKALTKTQIVTELADASGIAKKDVSVLLDKLSELIKKELAKGQTANFSLPGLIKIEKQYVAAREAQMGVPNPFKPGETIDRPAQPEHYKIKVRALKALKDMA